MSVLLKISAASFTSLSWLLIMFIGLLPGPGILSSALRNVPESQVTQAIYGQAKPPVCL